MAGLRLARLSSEKVEEERQDNADNDARGNREVESKIVSLDQNVSRQFSKPWDLRRKYKENSDYGNNNAHHNKGFSKGGHGIHGSHTKPEREI